MVTRTVCVTAIHARGHTRVSSRNPLVFSVIYETASDGFSGSFRPVAGRRGWWAVCEGGATLAKIHTNTTVHYGSHTATHKESNSGFHGRGGMTESIPPVCERVG